MRLREIFIRQESKWDSVILHNQTLRIKYFKPIFNTADGLAIGMDDKGSGLEFSLDDHDGWELKPSEPEFLDYYRVIEAYRIKDKRYLTVHSKEWYDNLDDALAVYKKEGFYITKVKVEKKFINWTEDMVFNIERVSKDIEVSCDDSEEIL